MPAGMIRKVQDSEGEKYLEKAIRLDKYLADMGKGTRTELKEMIRKGRIKAVSYTHLTLPTKLEV